MPSTNEPDRFEFAKNLIIEAGDLALQYFGNMTELSIMSKGARDMVSEADFAVERLIRDRLTATYPPRMPIWARKQGTGAAAVIPEPGSSTRLTEHSPFSAA